jgi:hypothetical protein
MGKWTEVEKILKNPNSQHAVNRFKSGGANFHLEDAVDFRIYLMDGTFKVVRLPGGDLTTAGSLRDGVAGMVHIPEECHKLFAICVVSASLSIQLDDDMKPLQRLQLWPEMLERYTDPAQWTTIQREVPLLVFRRNQLLTLSEERRIKSHVAMKFLFDEVSIVTVLYTAMFGVVWVLRTLLLCAFPFAAVSHQPARPFARPPTHPRITGLG